MEHEEKTMCIAEKLLYIQQNLKAPKGQYNSFGDYHYSKDDKADSFKRIKKTE